MDSLRVSYSEDYIEQSFQAWYKLGCPSLRKLIAHMPADEHGNVPSLFTLEKWVEGRSWYNRRDEMDAEVYRRRNNALIEDKMRLIEEQLKKLEGVENKAYEYIMTTGFDTSASAVSALMKSVEKRLVLVGVSKLTQTLAAMNDEDISSKLRELSARAGSDDIVDAESDDVEEDAEPE